MSSPIRCTSIRKAKGHCQLDGTLYVDGIQTADLNTSEKVELFLTVGDHILGVRICLGGNSETSVTVAADRKKVFRISSSQNGDIQIQPSAF